MRKIILMLSMLTLTTGAYAGPAAGELGTMAGENAVKTDVQAPPAPVDTRMAGCAENPMFPGCPKYCHTIGWGSPVCPKPLYCNTNPNGYGCQKSDYDKSADAGDALFDPGLAKANCASNPAAPGCPLFCKDHHAYPGCPMYCQLNPLSPACGHVPAYCGTNPNGYNCPKSAGEKNIKDEGFDEALAKANCTANPGAPGCPLFCKDHHAYPGCPMYCQLNPMSPACKKEAPETKSNCAYNPSEPGCPAFCASPGMQMYPGCPMYCAGYPTAPECQDKKAGLDNAGDDTKKVTPGYPKPPHPQYCQNHHGLPSCR